MIPAPFEYHRASSVTEALQLLTTLPEAKLLAGGHSLLPMMKLRLVSPTHVVDLGRIEALRFIRRDGQVVVAGALATHWMVESSDVVRGAVPLLAETAAKIGDVQVRNAGTIGGSLAHADPAADYPAAILALDAQMVAQSPRGRRTIPAGEFFTGLFSTALASDEILVEVRIPVPSGATGSAYLKFAHPASGFAVVGVAAVITVDAQGRCASARVGVTGVGPAAYRPARVEAQLKGAALDDKTVGAAAEHAAEGVNVNEDLFASAEYRAHLARVFTKRAVLAAAQRAR
ncbi:MAG: xanthine dehydrogenase family protein subunit M [Bacillati bacterium ANGP1]|uniref:Xanthine dehydrogenase family protein subunit M n=3 Tax=Candidatus Segetimicrobium genomatis TaxID=2569760 RepID=A0A537LRB0_9BACT|nr:MAG: xanthine dehydrogenase family protein subunit M [Terrabacteria group bacterium ANGP1]